MICIDKIPFLSTLSLRRATNKKSDHLPPTRISIHALLAESDSTSDVSDRVPLAISIHALLAESDQSRAVSRQKARNFYPRSPCGERHAPNRRPCPRSNFYPRSPCGERLFEYMQVGTGILFLSTLSLRRATKISFLFRLSKKFLSTLSLRRATLTIMLYDTSALIFLSTLSLRRATAAVC